MDKRKHISLDEIGNKIPFSVPENYFEQFAVQMDDQMGVATIPVKRMLKPWMYMAAMFVGVLLLAQVVYSVYNNNKAKNEMFELYVLSQMDDSHMADIYFSDTNGSKNGSTN